MGTREYLTAVCLFSVLINGAKFTVSRESLMLGRETTLDCILRDDSNYANYMQWRLHDDPHVVLVRNLTRTSIKRKQYVSEIKYTFVPTADMNTNPPTIYDCIALIRKENLKINFEVEINIPPTDPKIVSSNNVQAGVPATFVCKSKRGRPKPTLAWRIGSAEYQGSEKTVDDEHGTQSVTNTLVVTLRPADHNKVIYCDSTYIYATRTKVDKQVLTVEYKPIVSTPVTSHGILRHVASSIHCVVQAVPDAMVTWKKAGIPIRLDSSRYSNKPDTNLTFIKPTRADTGSYVCSATNRLGTTNSSAISVIMMYGPIVSLAPKKTVITEGMTLTLTCTVDAYPPPTKLSWIKFIFVKPRHWYVLNCTDRINCGSLKSPINLTIAPVHRDDAADYRCMAFNRVKNSDTERVTVIVKYGPTLRIAPEKISINEGLDVHIACSIDAYPLQTKVVWKRFKSKQWDTVKCSGRFSCGSLDSPSSLNITHVNRDDAAQYACEVYNEINKTLSSRVPVIVSYKPTLTLKPNNVTIPEGLDLELSCSIDAYPSPQNVRWRKFVKSQSVNVQCSGRHSCGSLQSPSNLTIKPVERDDAAEYACEVHNEVGTALSPRVRVIVTYGPTLRIAPEKISINEGFNVHIACSIDAYPLQTKVVWKRFKSKQWDTVKCSGRFSCGSLDSPSSLNITHVNRDDAAQYACEVYNEINKTLSSRVPVIVSYKPTLTLKPSNVTIPEGLDLELSCSIDAYPSPQNVRWRKFVKSQSVNVQCSGRHSCGSLQSPSNLTIKPVERDDAAEYACEVHNEVGTALSPRVRVIVSYGPTLRIAPEKISINEGLDVHIACSIDAYPLQTKVVWKRFKSKQLEAVKCSGRFSCGSLDSPSSLNITHVNRDDAAQYACEVYNEINKTLSSRVPVIVSYKPTLTLKPNNVTIPEGLDLELSCSIDAYPSPQNVRWRKFVKSQSVNVQCSGRHSCGSLQSPSNLTIKPVERDDAAEYACEVHNEVGTALSPRVRVIVTYGPTLRIAPEKISINEGLNVHIACSIDAYPLQTKVVWKRFKSKQWDTVKCSGRFSCGSLNSPSSLNITHVNRDDAAQYACEVYNEINKTLSSRVPVIVSYKPTLTLKPNNVTILEGLDLELSCSIDAYPSPQNVRWRKFVKSQSVNVQCSGRHSCGSLQSPTNLTIKPVERDDAAEYACEVHNEVGTALSPRVRVIVTYPPTLTVEPERLIIREGLNAEIMCSIDSYPLPSKIVWKRYVNSKWEEVQCSGRFSCGPLKCATNLTITTVTRDDAAEYVCEVSNDVGRTVSSSIPLTVTNAPILAITPHHVTVQEGQNVDLLCFFQLDPPASKISWKKHVSSEWEAIDCSGRFSCGALDSPSNLTITHVVRGDAGQYVCEVRFETHSRASDPVEVTVYHLPTVHNTTGSITTTEGSSVQLTCSFDTNCPPLRLTWTKYSDSQPSSVDCSGRFSCGALQSPSTLTITPVSRHDEGEYACQVSNEVGSSLGPKTWLHVMYSSDISVKPSSVRVKEGSSLQLTCVYDLNPPAREVVWKRYAYSAWYIIECFGRFSCGPTQSPSTLTSTLTGTLTSTLTNTLTSTLTGTLTSTLTITPVNRSDAARYACEVFNGPQRNLSSLVTVVVTYRPYVTVSPVAMTAMQGQDVNLMCTVDANPNITDLSWIRVTSDSKVTLQLGGHYSGGSLTSPSLLIIHSVNVKDEGFYVCQAVNPEGIGESNKVYVVIEDTRSSYTFLEGSNGTIHCPIHPAAPPVGEVGAREMEWVKDGFVLNVSTVGVLKLVGVQTRDAGTYVCSTKIPNNKRTSHKITVEVMYIPQAVQPVTMITANLGQPLSLTCATKAYPKVTTYVWRYKNQTLSETGETLTVTLTSITFGRFTCWARNEIGISKPIVFIVKERSHKPTILVVVKRKTTHLKWLYYVVPAVVVVLLFSIWWYKKGLFLYRGQMRRWKKKRCQVDSSLSVDI